MTYSGILRPLLESLQRGSKPRTGTLAGQELKTKRSDVGAFLAVDETGNVHFLLNPAPISDSRFSRFRLKSFSIDLRRWAIAKTPGAVYLDISCRTADQPTLSRPFLAFCEDLLLEFDDSTAAVEDAVFRTAQRWYRFWNRETARTLSESAIRGLIGELSFLAHIIEKNGSAAINTWTGPEGRDHDFQTRRELAVEIKTSAAIPYRIECNLNQLDRGLFGVLYLVCYAVQTSPAGVTLPGVVASIRAMLAKDEDAGDTFERKLILVGYESSHEGEYAQQHYSVAQAEGFLVDDQFPAVTLASFIRPPDMRVIDVRYVLELTALAGMPLTSEPIANALSTLR